MERAGRRGRRRSALTASILSSIFVIFLRTAVRSAPIPLSWLFVSAISADEAGLQGVERAIWAFCSATSFLSAACLALASDSSSPRTTGVATARRAGRRPAGSAAGAWAGGGGAGGFGRAPTGSTSRSVRCVQRPKRSGSWWRRITWATSSSCERAPLVGAVGGARRGHGLRRCVAVPRRALPPDDPIPAPGMIPGPSNMASGSRSAAV